MKVKMRATIDWGASGKRYKRGEIFVADRKLAKVLKLMGKAVDYHGPDNPQTYQTRALTAEQPQTSAPKTQTQKAEAPIEEEKASMSMTKPELVAMAKSKGVEIETDDNKLDLVRKINRYRRRDLRAEE